MNSIARKDRAMGAMMGTIIGDALGVGPHWYYDLQALRNDYGPWISDYQPPLPHRYHAGLKAGESSQSGQVFTLLLESVAARNGYAETDFTLRLDGLLATLDGTPQSGRYTDHAMRDVWQARHEGRSWADAGSFADTAEAAMRTPILAVRFQNDFALALKQLIANITLTHRDSFIVGQSTAFGLIIWALVNGVSLAEVSQAIPERARKHKVALSTPVLCAATGPGATPSPAGSAAFFDAILQPSWSHAAAHDPAIHIEPAGAACRLFGLACTLGFMLPAAYYFAARFENDFELAVLSAINGGGNNMARAALTGAVSGAQVGLSGIPERFITGLAESDRLLDLTSRIAEAAENGQGQ
jgi:ADP-ribosyl-[dinitrogen reductase] hydrolase